MHKIAPFDLGMSGSLENLKNSGWNLHLAKVSVERAVNESPALYRLPCQHVMFCPDSTDSYGDSLLHVNMSAQYVHRLSNS